MRKRYFFAVLMLILLPCAVVLSGCSVKHLVTLDVNNASYGYVVGSGKYDEGEKATIKAVAKTGYKFDCWSDNNTENPRIITVNEDVQLTAIFKQAQRFTVQLNCDTVKGSVSGTGQYYEGETITIRASQNPWYYFTCWSDGNNQPIRQITVTQNMSLTANFVQGNAKVWYNNHYIILVNGAIEETQSSFKFTPINESAFSYYTDYNDFFETKSNYEFYKYNLTKDYVIYALETLVGYTVVNQSDSDIIEDANVNTYSDLLNFVYSSADIGSYATIYVNNGSNQCKFLSSSNASVFQNGTYLNCELYHMEYAVPYYYTTTYILYTKPGDDTIYIKEHLRFGAWVNFNNKELTLNGTKTIYVKPIQVHE